MAANYMLVDFGGRNWSFAAKLPEACGVLLPMQNAWQIVWIVVKTSPRRFDSLMRSHRHVTNAKVSLVLHFGITWINPCYRFMCTYLSSSRRTPAASAFVRLSSMGTEEVQVLQKFQGTFAFKDKLDHEVYRSQESIVDSIGAMFHIREGLPGGGCVPLFCALHERYINQVHSHILAVRVVIAKLCRKVTGLWQFVQWCVASRRIVCESDLSWV